MPMPSNSPQHFSMMPIQETSFGRTDEDVGSSVVKNIKKSSLICTSGTVLGTSENLFLSILQNSKKQKCKAIIICSNLDFSSKMAQQMCSRNETEIHLEFTDFYTIYSYQKNINE